MTAALSYATDGNDLSGLEKLSSSWHKLTHHRSKLMIVKNCESKHERISITSKNGKHFLIHDKMKGQVKYEIISCVIRQNKETGEDIFDLEILKTGSARTTKIIVKNTVGQAIWFGLNSRVSTDLFINDTRSSQYEAIKVACD